MLGETFETGVGVPGVGFGIGGLAQFELNSKPSTTSIRRIVIFTLLKGSQDQNARRRLLANFAHICCCYENKSFPLSLDGLR
jgi:hypothetical protein